MIIFYFDGALCLVVFCRRASAAVNYLKRFHEKKKRGPKPNSLYLDHIVRKSLAAHYCRDQHLRPQRDIFVIKVVAVNCRKDLMDVIFKRDLHD